MNDDPEKKDQGEDTSNPDSPGEDSPEKAEAENPNMKYYKHPFKNTDISLLPPTTKKKAGRDVRVPGISITLRNHYFETDDLEIQALIKKCPQFHPGGIEEISKEQADRIKGIEKPGTKYQDGPSRLVGGAMGHLREP